MLTVTRFTIALIVSLGLASSAFATPVTFGVVTAASDSLASSLTSSELNFTQAKIDTSFAEARLDTQHISKDGPKKKNDKISKVPEPSSLLLLGLGLVGLGFLRRRKH